MYNNYGPGPGFHQPPANYYQNPPPMPQFAPPQQQQQWGAPMPPQGYYNQPPPMQQQQYYQHQSQPAPLPPLAPMRQQAPTTDLNNPNVFRQYFSSGLQALTFNSKPIITDLTILAGDYSLRMANIISDELQTHLLTTDPSYKLPALYLMDSIAKNVGPPYIGLFSRWVERIFLSVYRDVDPPTKVKMEELLGTWRTGGQHGQELYISLNPMHGNIQRNIEEQLFGRQLRGGGIGGGGRPVMDNRHFLNGVQQQPSLAQPEERNALTDDIRRIIGLRQAQAYRDPHDKANVQQMDSLQKLQTLVATAGLTSDQIHHIRQQLAALTPAEAGFQPPQLPHQNNDSSIMDTLSSIDSSTISALLAAQQPLQPVPSTSALPDSGGSLYDNLLKSGLVNVNMDNVASALQGLDPGLLASLGAAVGQDKKEQSDKENEYERKLFAGYEKQVGRIGLTSAEINKPKPDTARLILSELSIHCVQCSARWLDTPRHKQVYQQHLDRHFRNNNRINNATRAQGRDWFTSLEDWIHPPVASTVELKTDQEVADAEVAEIVKATVVAPSDPTKAAKPCPICKESFKSVFKEDKEEWVWTDAKKVDGVIYHASCHAETMKSRLQNRLKREEGAATPLSSSREGTPVTSAMPSPKASKLVSPKVEPVELERDTSIRPATQEPEPTASPRPPKRPAEDEPEREAEESEAKRVKQETDDS